MSNRRKPLTPVTSTLDNLAGYRLPGGCPDCAACQEVTKQDTGIYTLTVSHDGTCPWLNARTRGR